MYPILLNRRYYHHHHHHYRWYYYCCHYDNNKNNKSTNILSSTTSIITPTSYKNNNTNNNNNTVITTTTNSTKKRLLLIRPRPLIITGGSNNITFLRTTTVVGAETTGTNTTTITTTTINQTIPTTISSSLLWLQQNQQQQKQQQSSPQFNNNNNNDLGFFWYHPLTSTFITNNEIEQPNNNFNNYNNNYNNRIFLNDNNCIRTRQQQQQPHPLFLVSSNNPKQQQQQQQRLYNSTSSSSSEFNNNNNIQPTIVNTTLTGTDDEDPVFKKLYQSTRELLSQLTTTETTTTSNKTSRNNSTTIIIGTQIIQNPQLVHNLEQQIEKWYNYITKNDYYYSSSNNNKYNTTTARRTVSEIVQQQQRDGIEAMKELYSIWLRTVQYIRNRKLQDKYGTILPSSVLTSSSSTRRATHPFQLMMQLYATIVPNNGTEALQILHDWNDIYNGNIELRPTRDDYNIVLQSYANIVSNPSSSSTSTNRSITTKTSIIDNRNILLYQQNIQEGAVVAMEIREQLELWGYTMYPNLLTYQLIIKCLSNAIFERSNNSNKTSENGGFSSIIDTSSSLQMDTLRNDLQSTMEQFIQQFNKNKKRGSSDNDNSIIIDGSINNNEYVILVTAISDYIRSIDAIIEQSQSKKDITSSTIRSDPLVEQVQQYWSQLFSLDPNKNRQITKLNTLKESLSSSSKQHSLLLLPEMDGISSLNIKKNNNNNKELHNLLDTTTNSFLELYRQQSLLPVGSQTDDIIVNDVTQYMNSLKQVIDNYDSTMLVPTLNHYHKAILIIKNCRNNNQTHDEPTQQQQYQQVSQYLLEQMKALYETQITTTTLISDGTERTIWSNVYMMGCIDAEQYNEVSKIWDDMKRLYRIRPDALSYNLILHALANGPKDGAMQRAQQAHSIWKKLLLISFSASSTTTNTSTANNNNELDHFSNHDDYENEAKDSSLHQQKRTYNIHPNPRHYASVMVAWSRSYHPNAATYCQEVFHRLIQDSKEHPLIQLGMPSLIHYTALITTLGWSKQPGTNRRVIQLFKEYQKHAPGMTHRVPNDDHYDDEDSNEVNTKFKMYSTVLYALSRLTKTTEDAIQAEEILNDMIHESAISHNNGVTSFPNVECYNSVMKAWGRANSSLDVHDRCDKIFQKLQTAYQKSNYNPVLMPNSTTYVALIEALSNHTKAIPNSGIRAMELLDRMERSAQRKESTQPDATVYTAVMTTIWKENKDDAVDNVERILGRMIQAYENGNLAAKPDAHTMTVVLQTWARSNRPDKANVSWKILEEQMLGPYQQGDISLKPSVYSFAAVLSACAYSVPSATTNQSSDEVIRIALTVMNHLDSGTYGSPNEYTYKNLLQTICYQKDDSNERGRLVGVIFQRCCQDGYVSAGILRILQKYTPNLYKKLPIDSKTSKIKVPFEWNRNIPKKNI